MKYIFAFTFLLCLNFSSARASCTCTCLGASGNSGDEFTLPSKFANKKACHSACINNKKHSPGAFECSNVVAEAHPQTSFKGDCREEKKCIAQEKCAQKTEDQNDLDKNGNTPRLACYIYCHNRCGDGGQNAKPADDK